MDIVCDTNVWYDIGSGRMDVRTLKGAGHALLVSPISFLEVGSKVGPSTFRARKAAAQAVLQHADQVLEDPERHLAALWGIHVPQLTIDWMDGFRAIADAATPEDIERGVDDFQGQVRRTVNLPLLSIWRTYHWQSFEDKIILAIDGVCPGYARARAEGRAKYMNRRLRIAFRAFLDHDEMILTTILGTRLRVLLHNPDAPADPTEEELRLVRPQLDPYARAYREYLLKVATTFAPRANDWGDVECFVYLQDGRCLLTSDQRWIDIATDAGYGALLATP